jgi:rubredoxin
MPYSFDKEHFMERYHCQTCGHDHDVERCPRCGSNQKDLYESQARKVQEGAGRLPDVQAQQDEQLVKA